MLNNKPTYEFLLWDNCNNNCTFCFQRKSPNFCSIAQKKDSLEKVLTFLSTDEYVVGSHVLLVGGEIFDDLCMFNFENEFFSKIIDKMLLFEIDILYVNTNLIYKDMSCLFTLLDFIENNNLFDRFKFTTSYDLKGRFNKKDSEETFKNNLIFLKNKYPRLNIVVNTILTKDVCNKILCGEFNIKSFCEKYLCSINLLPYLIYEETLTASKEEIFDTLNSLDIDYLKSYIENLDSNHDKLLYKYLNGQLIFCSCEKAECGHPINFKMYSSDNSCYLCDIKEVFSVKF